MGKKIVILNGSPRKKGNTSALAHNNQKSSAKKLQAGWALSYENKNIEQVGFFHG